MANGLTLDEARRVAGNIAKLPGLEAVGRPLRPAPYSWWQLAPRYLLAERVAAFRSVQATPIRVLDRHTTRWGLWLASIQISKSEGIPTTVANTKSAPLEDTFRIVHEITDRRLLKTMLAVLRARCRGALRFSEDGAVIQNNRAAFVSNA